MRRNIFYFITLNNEAGVRVFLWTHSDQIVYIDGVFTLGPNTQQRFVALFGREA